LFPRNLVSALPSDPKPGTIYTIDTRDVSYLTHNFFKYPCKFIPQIPAWALDNLIAEKAIKPVIYDPFVGSGTTLVEAVIRGYDGVGSDIDPLGRLLTTVKTTTYSQRDIRTIEADFEKILSYVKHNMSTFQPEIPNLNHWFTPEAIDYLSRLKSSIELLSNKKSQNFFFIVLASVIKRVSLADDASPKPYVSTRILKKPADALAQFQKRYFEDIVKLKEFSKIDVGKLVHLGNDARQISFPEKSVDLAITSPPYINAFDYVRTLRLENLWLGLASNEEIQGIRKGNIGTESIAAKDIVVDDLGSRILKDCLSQVAEVDKKRAGIITKYFQDMKENFTEVHRVLKDGGNYVVVVADSTIRSVTVPTHQILMDLAIQVGFEVELHFGYSIENRYLRIPRLGRGGFMDVDWILVFKKVTGE
jgi:DNA modification methylase